MLTPKGNATGPAQPASTLRETPTLGGAKP